MSWGPWILGGSVAALVALVAAKASGALSTAPKGLPTVLPTGTYTRLIPTTDPTGSSSGVTLQPGATYLMSRTIPSGDTTTLATAVAEIQKAGFTVFGAWPSVPPGWPSDDPNTAGPHVAVKTNATVGQSVGTDVAVWQVTAATKP